jgi:hypothetical protein
MRRGLGLPRRQLAKRGELTGGCRCRPERSSIVFMGLSFPKRNGELNFGKVILVLIIPSTSRLVPR